MRARLARAILALKSCQGLKRALQRALPRGGGGAFRVQFGTRAPLQGLGSGGARRERLAATAEIIGRALHERERRCQILTFCLRLRERCDELRAGQRLERAVGDRARRKIRMRLRRARVISGTTGVIHAMSAHAVVTQGCREGARGVLQGLKVVVASKARLAELAVASPSARQRELRNDGHLEG